MNTYIFSFLSLLLVSASPSSSQPDTYCMFIENVTALPGFENVWVFIFFWLHPCMLCLAPASSYTGLHRVFFFPFNLLCSHQLTINKPKNCWQLLPSCNICEQTALNPMPSFTSCRDDVGEVSGCRRRVTCVAHY